MTKERLERIKENIYTRCNIATTTGIGMTAPDREELELLEEIERLNNIIKNQQEDIEEYNDKLNEVVEKKKKK